MRILQVSSTTSCLNFDFQTETFTGHNEAMSEENDGWMDPGRLGVRNFIESGDK